MGKILRFIKNLKAKIKEMKTEYRITIENYAEKYSEYLENGVYKPNETLTAFYNVKYKKFLKNDDNFIFKNIILKKNISECVSSLLAKKIIAAFIKIKIFSVDKRFTGHAVYFSSMGHEIRFIDFNNCTLLTLFKNNYRMAKIMAQRAELERIFNTPKILSVHENNFYIIEEYKFRKKISIELCFKKVMEDVLNFQQNIECEKQVLTYNDVQVKDIDDEIKRLNLNYRKQVIDFIKKGFYKKCLCHGDLYKLNVMFDGNEFCYIDYEMGGGYIFFNDILFFIFMEIYRFDNRFLYDSYMDGKYDEYFSKLFKVNGAAFIPQHKKMYFFIMIQNTYHNIYGVNIPDSIKWLFE